MLHIEKTNHTPGIIIDSVNNKILFDGESRPENVKKFYDPVMLTIQDYIASLSKRTTIQVDFKFEYLNSTSIKCVYDILVLLENQVNNHDVESTWYYLEHDELMQENGVDFGSLVPQLKLKIKEL